MAHEAVSLEIEIALDLVAAHLHADGGPTFVLAAGEALRAAVAARFDGHIGFAWPLPDQGSTARRLLVVSPRSPPPLESLHAAVAPDGCLALVGPGPLAPLFDRLRGLNTSARLTRSPTAAIRGAGFTIELSAAIGGLDSIALAALGRAAERAERLDLADRLGFAYRRSLAPRPGGWPGELTVLLARRAVRHG